MVDGMDGVGEGEVFGIDMVILEWVVGDWV